MQAGHTTVSVTRGFVEAVRHAEVTRGHVQQGKIIASTLSLRDGYSCSRGEYGPGHLGQVPCMRGDLMLSQLAAMSGHAQNGPTSLTCTSMPTLRRRGYLQSYTITNAHNWPGSP